MPFVFPNGTTTEPRNPGNGEYGPRAPVYVPGFAPTRPFHVGHDWNWIGAVCAISDGIVIFAGVDPSMPWAGVQVLIDHGVHDGRRVWSRSCHLKTATAYKGQRVKAGQQIGVEGATGLAAGVHLHIEVYVGRVNRGTGVNPGNTVSPRDFINANLAAPSGGGSSTTVQEDDMRIISAPNGDCFMVGLGRIKHLGTLPDLAAAEHVFGNLIKCTDRQFRVALIGLGIPYGVAVKGADWAK